MSESFRQALRRVGLDYAGEIIADGRLRRFRGGKDRERNSWYVLHAGPPAAAAFGCWRRGFSETWCGARNGELSQAEWNRVREQWKQAERERERTESELREKARKTALWILAHATPATDDHPYLKAKGVRTCNGLSIWRGALVVPLLDVKNEVHSLQFIGADGTKRFLRGGRVAGCFFTVSGKADGPLVIAEGYATSASIHEATGFAIVCAMNAGNLKAVAQSLRSKWPGREIVIAADNDAWTDGNPGHTKAREAALAVGAKLAVPRFADVTGRPADFNDLHQREGLATVNAQIENATTPTETDAEAYERLAKLSPADYDRARDDEAERLGIRAATLDKQVAGLRPKACDNAQGFPVDLPDVEPWPDPVDGAEVLSDVAADFSRYLFLPDGAADAVTLWTAVAHCFEAFLHSPRLNLRSAEKGCGKTTLLDVLASLVPRAMRTENMTSAVLFRVIDRYRPTLLLDEVDAYLDENEELRGLLNAGHRRGARAYRVEGESLEVRGFNAFAPAVLAGIGGLTGKLSTLHDRSVVVDLVRAKPGEIPERFDSRRTAHETELCRKLARWAADNFAKLESWEPKLPDSAFNRLADNWRPLFAVAEVAGGDWPRRAADAFAKLTSGNDMDAQGVGATLLADIAAIFAAAGEDKLASARICEQLASIEGRPWAEWGRARKPISPNQLANQLRRFKVAPKTIKLADGKTAKGYPLSAFSDAFARFAPTPSFPDRNPVTTPANIDDSAVSETSPQNTGLRIEIAQNPNETQQGYGVTVQKPQPAEFANADLW